MRYGVVIVPGTGDLDAQIRTIRQAEEAGFASAWLANIFGLDALTVLALAGKETSRIELGTAVVPTYPRHPTSLAQQALTVQVAAGGRLALGIGLSHQVVIEGMFGLDYSKPIPHTREYLTILNGLLAGERTVHKGELYQVAAQYTVPGATKPPVLVAALGPAMLRLCGRLADGTVTWMGGLAYLRDVAVPTITEAAEKAGRPKPRIVASLPILVTTDPAAARETADTSFQVYGQLPSYRATLDRGGAKGPGDVAVVGSEDEIRAHLDQFAAAGVTDFAGSIYSAPGGNPQRTYELLSDMARKAIV